MESNIDKIMRGDWHQQIVFFYFCFIVFFFVFFLFFFCFFLPFGATDHYFYCLCQIVASTLM